MLQRTLQLYSQKYPNLCLISSKYLHCKSNKSVRDRIISNTIICNDHLTPELRLRLITPKCSLYFKPIRDASEKVFENDPFWGFYWPGGQALSRYILDNANLVRNKNVLDVGSGSGACSIASAFCGAKYALANDIDYVASVAAHLNAALNKVSISTSTENFIENQSSCSKYDLILLGDVFYDNDMAEQLMPWLQQIRKSGKNILIGDPGRHGLTSTSLAFMEKVAQYNLTQSSCIENNGFKVANVWRFL